MISFAGFDLTLDSKYQHLQRYLESIGHDAVPQGAILPWLRQSWPSGVSLPSYELPKLGLNQFYWPTGTDRPGFGHFLISQEVQSVLNDPDLNPNSEGVAYGKRGTLKFNTTGDVADDVYIHGMSVISCTPLFIVDSDAPLYVLTLGDERYRSLMTSCTLDENNWDSRSPGGIAGATIADAANVLLPYSTSCTYDPAVAYTFNFSSRWNRLAVGMPGPLAYEQLLNLHGRRSVWRFGHTSDTPYPSFPAAQWTHSVTYWTEAKDDLLWSQVEPRLMAGGRLTDEEVKNQLPESFYIYYDFTDATSIPAARHSTFRTLSSLLGETAVTNTAVTCALHAGIDIYDVDYENDAVRNWLKCHLGRIEGTIAGIVPLDLTAGVDYVLATHHVDSCRTEIFRWGKVFHGWPSYEMEYDPFWVTNFTSNPSFTTAPPGITFGNSKIQLPSQGYYEVDLRVHAQVTSGAVGAWASSGGVAVLRGVSGTSTLGDKVFPGGLSGYVGPQASNFATIINVSGDTTLGQTPQGYASVSAVFTVYVPDLQRDLYVGYIRQGSGSSNAAPTLWGTMKVRPIRISDNRPTSLTIAGQIAIP